MRNRSFATLGVLALLAAASAFGQEGLRANIPFEFRIGTTVMPAGQYVVDRPVNGASGILSVQCHTCAAHVLVLVYNGRGGPKVARGEGRLSFNKYGDTYFLSSAWLFGDGSSSALPLSKAEREIGHSASLAQTSQVVLAARR